MLCIEYNKIGTFWRSPRKRTANYEKHDDEPERKFRLWERINSQSIRIRAPYEFTFMIISKKSYQLCVALR